MFPVHPILQTLPHVIFLFPKLKSFLAGRKYQSRHALGSAIHQYLITVPNSAYRDTFEKRIHRLKLCISSHGEYFDFEGMKLAFLGLLEIRSHQIEISNTFGTSLISLLPLFIWSSAERQEWHYKRRIDNHLKVKFDKRQMGTLSGEATCICIFASHLIGVNSQRKEFAPFKSRPYFGRATLSRKANRKSQKLFPFVKMTENHGGVLIYLKSLNFSALLSHLL